MLTTLKNFLRDTIGVPPPVVLMLTGLLLHLALNLILRRPLTAASGLIAPLVVGLLVEAYEIWDAYRDSGLFAHGNDPLSVIFVRHLTDVLIMMSAPIAIVATDLLISARR